MDDVTFNEIRDRLMLDKDFIEFVRAAFMKSFEDAVSVKVQVETKYKRCPICHSGMILRASKKDGGFFWGCAAYPRCKGLSQASAAEIAEYKENYPEQFKILQDQQEVYKADFEASGVKGYDNEQMREKKTYKRRKDEENVKFVDSRDKDAVVNEILEESNVKPRKKK